MRTTILISTVSIYTCLSFSLLHAQTPEDKITKRFLPYAGVTYNFHTIKELSWSSDEVGYHFSHFPGIEIGFKISPVKENGWQIEYKNTFLGELAIYGIYDLSTNPGNAFLENIVNRTIGNGFLGRLDVCKSIIHTPTQRMNAGFIVSDKVILGTEDYPLYYNHDQETYTNTGFHFTPGIFASYEKLFQNQSVLSVNVSFSQSLFNLHQFNDDNATDNFVLPLFTELQINYQMPGGVYFKTGTIIPSSFNGVSADARISVGAGYTFRYK
ncbi:MAG: hypothetical protein ABFS28_15500 [Bacteroidota bacterium]